MPTFLTERQVIELRLAHKTTRDKKSSRSHQGNYVSAQWVYLRTDRTSTDD